MEDPLADFQCNNELSAPVDELKSADKKKPVLSLHPRAVRRSKSSDTECNERIKNWRFKKEKLVTLKKLRKDAESEHHHMAEHVSSKVQKRTRCLPPEKDKTTLTLVAQPISQSLLDTVESGLKLYELNKSSMGKKPKLEREMEEAIEARDFQLAEKLSDEMTSRDTAMKLKAVMDASNAMMEDQRSVKSRRRKKKLRWNFEEKGRWESKGNM